LKGKHLGFVGLYFPDVVIVAHAGIQMLLTAPKKPVFQQRMCFLLYPFLGITRSATNETMINALLFCNLWCEIALF
jgi:hypothetical protein